MRIFLFTIALAACLLTLAGASGKDGVHKLLIVGLGGYASGLASGLALAFTED